MNTIITTIICIIFVISIYSLSKLLVNLIKTRSISIAASEFLKLFSNLKRELFNSKLNEPNDYLKAQEELDTYNFSTAKSYIETYLQDRDSDPRALFTLAEIYTAQGKFKAAINLIQKIEMDYTLYSVFNNFGQLDKLAMALYKLSGDVDIAKHYKKMYIEKNNNHISLEEIEKLFDNPNRIQYSI